MNTRSDRGRDSEAIAEAEVRFSMIEARIEHQLSDEQVAQVKQRIAQSIELGRVLRAYPLANADEPEIGFVPYRGEDR